MSRHSFQRKLRAIGTTLSAEIGELLQSDRSVTEGAASDELQNPTSFTRAFKAWAGESPREFRKKRRMR
jgi:AraC-like DNA-binding protein